MSSPSDYPIDVTRVEKRFAGGVRALDGASFRVREGERACLLGPNGAGKTTLVRILTGALRPTGGTALLFGRTASAPDFLASKRRVGIVPQHAGMYRDFTVQEHLELVRRLYGRGSLGDVLERFGLGPYASRPLAALSGGFQRRLALACALLPKPDLLLLDEPTVGLDPVATREVHDFLREAMRGRTVLLCTHNLAEAETLCESAVIVRQGRVLVHENIEQLRAQAAPKLLLSARGSPAALLEAVVRLGFSAHLQGDQVLTSVSDAKTEAPRLLKSLLEEGVEVYECRVGTPRLEDLFLDIVGGAP